MKPRISQLAQSGATDGQAVIWDATAGQWVPATVTAASTVTRASDLTTAFAPLSTVTGGSPDLVWDADDSLILTEVPL